MKKGKSFELAINATNNPRTERLSQDQRFPSFLKISLSFHNDEFLFFFITFSLQFVIIFRMNVLTI